MPFILSVHEIILHYIGMMTECRVSGDTAEINGPNSSQCRPSLGELLGSFQINDCLIKLIHQFLLYNEFENTADSLVHEAPKLGFDVLSEHLCTNNSIPKEVCKAIMSHYVAGDWRHFFDLWNSLIPESIRESAEYKILTFKLHLHFAILPLRIKQLHAKVNRKDHDQMSSGQMMEIIANATETYFCGAKVDNNQSKQMISEAMEQLRIYLETDGRDFEENTELLPLFALPCLDDAQTYSTFPELFELSWMEDLTKAVQIFIMNRKQVRSTISQKTSTDTIMTTRCPYVCVQGDISSTYENINNFQDRLISIDPLSNIPITQNDLAKIPLEITKSTMMGLIPQQIKNTNTEIIVNDRDIPMFRKGHDLEDQFGYCIRQQSHRIHSKSAQTKISTLTTTTNFISTSDLYHPATILNSATFTKNMNASIESNQELAITKSHLNHIRYNYEKLKTRFHELHSDYHKLHGIAGELTAALENSVRGEAVDLQRMLESCVAIFPDLFNHNVRGYTSGTNVLLDQEVELKETDLTIEPHVKYNLSPVSPKLLDYKKIKFHLINGSVKTKLLLLQALRWKLTLSQPGDRDETINEYLRGDILGLHAQVACDSGKQILPYLLMPKNVATPHPLQQSAARLINTLASLRCGRDYLAIGASLLDLIIKCLTENNGRSIDAFTCDMIIATLQKMSLRKQQRLYMIETGLVEWLIFHLKSEIYRVGSYRLKYATALLMNLSLHKEAQIRASAIAPIVISTLTTLLRTDHLQALPYINGSLNSFLSNEVINEEAKRTGLTSILECHRNQNSGEIRKHLEHILKIHNRDYALNREDYETADDDNEELDELEDELEEGDPVKMHSGELSGEALLASCYSIPTSTTQPCGINVVESGPNTPKMHSRTNMSKNSQTQKHPPKKHHNDVQLSTFDIRLSPRLIPQHLPPHRKDIACDTSPVRSLLPVHYTSSIKRLSPVSIEGRQIVVKGTESDCPSVSEIYSSSTSRLTSKTSMISAALGRDLRIDAPSDKSEMSTHSPYFCSFTRTYKREKTSVKSIQPSFQSIDSSTAIQRDQRTEPQGFNEPWKMNQRSRFPKRNSNITSLLGQDEKMLKSVRLDYSVESDNSESALCLYANESSKGSSKTTVTSSAILGTTCDGVIAETEKLSSIASLDLKNVDASTTAKTTTVGPDENAESNVDKEIEAFAAKPRIARTPPLSAHQQLRVTSLQNETITRRVSTK